MRFGKFFAANIATDSRYKFRLILDWRIDCEREKESEFFSKYFREY